MVLLNIEQVEAPIPTLPELRVSYSAAMPPSARLQIPTANPKSSPADFIACASTDGEAGSWKHQPGKEGGADDELAPLGVVGDRRLDGDDIVEGAALRLQCNDGLADRTEMSLSVVEPASFNVRCTANTSLGMAPAGNGGKSKFQLLTAAPWSDAFDVGKPCSSRTTGASATGFPVEDIDAPGAGCSVMGDGRGLRGSRALKRGRRHWTSPG